MLESLEKAEKSYQKLSHDYKSLITRSENTQEKCKCLKLTVGSLKAEITALENKCKTYSQTIGKHEQTINVLREVCWNLFSSNFHVVKYMSLCSIYFIGSDERDERVVA